MAYCGIKEYDDLPARVKHIDVDYLRWRLHRCDHPLAIHHVPLLGWLLTPSSSADTRKRIVAKLDIALAAVAYEEAEYKHNQMVRKIKHG